jgi:class 3 adenylate cyclase
MPSPIGNADERRIRFRIGINLGDVIVEEHDIFGDGVNVAARLEALAEPGGICISRVVRDQIRDKLPYPFEDRASSVLRGLGIGLKKGLSDRRGDHGVLACRPLLTRGRQARQDDRVV